MRQWMWLVAGGILLGTTGTALADNALYPPCTTKPTDTEREAAKGAFKAGAGSYEEGDYNKAIMYWSDAYSRDCTAHALLLNLAAAYERIGDKEKAIISLQTYLDRVKNAPNRPLLEKRIANLKKQLEDQKRVTPPPATTTQPQQGGPQQTTTQPQPQPGQSATQSSNTSNGSPSSANQSDTSGSSSVEVGTDTGDSGGSSILPWIVTGVGGVALIGGVVVTVIGSNDYNDYKEKCPNGVCPDKETFDKANFADKERKTGPWIAVGGGLAVAGGLVWHFMFDKPSDSGAEASAKKSTLVATPVVSGQFSGLQLSGSF